MRMSWGYLCCACDYVWQSYIDVDIGKGAYELSILRYRVQGYCPCCPCSPCCPFCPSNVAWRCTSLKTRSRSITYTSAIDHFEVDKITLRDTHRAPNVILHHH